VDDIKELEAKREASLKEAADYERAIAESKEKWRAAHIEEVKSLMAQRGITIADLGATDVSEKKTRTSKLKGVRVAPKFKGPNGELWSGRGHTPPWAKGQDMEQFKIAA